MGILSKHLGGGEPIEIGEGENKDKIYLKPLTVEELPLIFKAMKAFSGASGENATTEDMLKNVDDDGANAIKELINKTLDKSLPEEPEEERRQFGLKYMMVLLPKIMELNMATDTSHEAVKKKEAMDKLKKRNEPNKE